MKKVLVVMLSVLLSLVAGVPAQAANKGIAAVASSTASLLASQLTPGATTSPWTTVLTAKLGADEGKARALLINVSMQTLIATNDTTLTPLDSVLSDGACIQLRVLVDGVEAKPGPVIFDNTMHFQQNFLSSLPNTQVIQEGGAHAFTWYKIGLGNTPGDTHLIQVQAQFYVNVFSYPDGFTFNTVLAEAGPGTVVVTQTQVDQEDTQVPEGTHDQ